MALGMGQRNIDPDVGDHLIGTEMLTGYAVIDVEAPVIRKDEFIAIFQVDVLEERHSQVRFSSYIQSAELEPLIVIMTINGILRMRIHESDASLQ